MLTELLSFMPYDKYALYVLASYSITTIVLGYLFIHSLLRKKKIIKQLRNKYRRQDNV